MAALHSFPRRGNSFAAALDSLAEGVMVAHPGLWRGTPSSAHLELAFGQELLELLPVVSPGSSLALAPAVTSPPGH